VCWGNRVHALNFVVTCGVRLGISNVSYAAHLQTRFHCEKHVQTTSSVPKITSITIFKSQIMRNFTNNYRN
jgi:hypothetical protein